MTTAVVTLPDGRRARLTGPDRASVLAKARELSGGAALSITGRSRAQDISPPSGPPDIPIPDNIPALPQDQQHAPKSFGERVRSDFNQLMDPSTSHQFTDRLPEPVRPLARLLPDTVAEAKAGKEMVKWPNIKTEVSHIPVVGPVADTAVRAQRVAIGAARNVFPLVGGLSKAGVGDPLRHVSVAAGASHKTAERIGTGGEILTPLGLFGFTKWPLAAERIRKLSPATQLGIAEIGGDADAIPSVANIIGRKERLAAEGASGVKGVTADGSSASPASENASDKLGLNSVSWDDLVGDSFNPSTRTRENLAGIAKDKFGFIIPRGARSGNRREQQIETATESLPGGSFQPEYEHNKRQLAKWVTGATWKPATEIDDQWVDGALKFFNGDLKVGKPGEFDRLAELTGPVPTRTFLQRAEKAVPGPIQKAERKRVQEVLKIIEEDYGPEISGGQYQEIRSQLEALGRNVDIAKPDLAARYREITRHLDDTLQEAATDPKVRAEWKDVRRRYKNFLILEESLDRGTGLLDPNKFARATEKSYRRGGRVKLGTNDMLDLASTLRTFKNQIPTSGTAERSAGIDQIKRTIVGGLGVGADVLVPGGMYLAAKGLKRRAFKGARPKTNEAKK